jgi:NADPH:quinone reductase-like Zn-dependent oxidoreductase
MKALVRHAYGLPDVLSVQDVEIPTPAPDEVLLEVCAASINPADWHILTADIFLVRFMGMGLLRPSQQIIGADVAGRVVAVGAEVKDLRPGDDVLGMIGQGGYAEYACAKATCFVRKPPEMSFEEAAAIPIAGVTALQGLRDHGRIEPGQHVLINGAGGGIGTFAVQLAKHFGAEVTGVCSTGKVDAVRRLGADHVIDYTHTDFTQGETRYDMILDTAAFGALLQYRRVLTEAGILVIAGGPFTSVLKALVMRPWFALTSRRRVVNYVAKETQEALQFLVDRYRAGELRPLISRRYAFPEIPEALAHLGEGHAMGKLVATIRERPSMIEATAVGS